MSERNGLFVLPFDHRGSFLEEMFEVVGTPTPGEIERVKYFKGMIYGGFKLAMLHGRVPVKEAAILADEYFSDDILRDAQKNGFRICVCAEKSGQKEFALEYGESFKEHIRKYNPAFVKALIRYNPEEDPELNCRQLQELKVLGDFCYEERYKLMLEPLVPATAQQLDSVNGDTEAYDQEIRPQLMELMMEELQAGGVEPDVWKIEGLDDRQDYEMLVQQARSDGRKADIIVLGRHASQAQVDRWLEAGKDLEGVTGFAVGRTVFWDPLVAYRDGKMGAEEAIERIAAAFEHHYAVFKGQA